MARVCIELFPYFWLPLRLQLALKRRDGSFEPLEGQYRDGEGPHYRYAILLATGRHGVPAGCQVTDEKRKNLAIRSGNHMGHGYRADLG
jgi:hypothetical protein